mmetsp:Transcript_14210/g.24329  ORF Transcript_14210/g.24329 Transcript_14210/m.24329 type:complete len:238 (-) Transcript_14210:224-937(-)|eukprot:CAMPEP_0184706748 /NCGR_PEP_ID=MMETSP0313-20130426/36916_1 /TAXON_ID=2792 /ORGANISM="Porphyridium aerugineum, Strain SAG 1380-2" /LENGTH=237 /DNA_ID=CAMNT_0027168309 /DNA_START=757 /DNA_END=1470 /DNA_ORIENTATION=+
MAFVFGVPTIARPAVTIAPRQAPTMSLMRPNWNAPIRSRSRVDPWLVPFPAATDISTIFEEMQKMMVPFYNEMEQFHGLLEKENWAPKFELKEDETDYHIRIEAPGIPKEHIKIYVKDNVLHVSGDSTQVTGHTEQDKEKEVVEEKKHDIKAEVEHAANKDEEKKVENPKLAKEEVAAPLAKQYTSTYVQRSFNRSFPLGKDVNADAITASTKDGIVHIKLPKVKPQEAAVKTINID